MPENGRIQCRRSEFQRAGIQVLAGARSEQEFALAEMSARGTVNATDRGPIQLCAERTDATSLGNRQPDVGETMSARVH